MKGTVISGPDPLGNAVVNLNKWFTLRLTVGAFMLLEEKSPYPVHADGCKMLSSRLFFTAIMLFWISFLSLLALVVTYAPQGGVELAGLTLFANSGLVDAAMAAMQGIGFSPVTSSVVFGIMAGFNVASAGLALFAMLFAVLGEETEQREARPLAEGAAACAAASAGLIVAVSLVGGEAGALLVLQLAALGGLLLTVMPFTSPSSETGNAADNDVTALDEVIADHAASHAAFSAQLASMSRRGAST
ncbi:hypothetical protein [Hoeflea sp.]|uniref:hypothetical protein n=1 Tax=Hoeflea sp. TaxID=1940281 RepID=UPI0019C31A65|nr:hypothetical protein [Hoeflea sp.]MBC7281548.1 hypothetical protein [Hoeflea sp.]